jgi:uncharacterized glyoxalase superfamily protein PhnB
VGSSPDVTPQPKEFAMQVQPYLFFEGRCEEAIAADSDAQAEKIFAALGEGGQVQMPMVKTFFASRFGMVADKFGVMWMVVVMGK